MDTNQYQTTEKGLKSIIFAVRTTIGQEKSVLQNMFNRLRILNPLPDLKALMIAEELRGYVFVEAPHQRDVMIAISGLRHVKGKVVGSITLDSISHVISPRKVTEILEEGDIVEIVSGIFANQKAQVIRMPKEGAKEEVTLRLLDSDSAISIKIHGDFLKLIEKGERHQEEYIIKNVETPSESTSILSPEITESPPPSPEPTFKPIPAIKISEEVTANTEDIYSFGEESESEFTQEEKPVIDKPKKSEKEKEESAEEDDEWAKFEF